MKKYISLLLLVALFSCKENTYIFEVDEVGVNPNNAEKDKEKTPEVFLNVAYANLYQEALSSNEQVQMSEVVQSIGDKQIAYETIIAKMMKDPAVVFPTNQEMRVDLGLFIEETYERFYVRKPTEAEKVWWVNYLESRPNITAELVYYSFATSNEYNFY